MRLKQLSRHMRPRLPPTSYSAVLCAALLVLLSVLSLLLTRLPRFPPPTLFPLAAHPARPAPAAEAAPAADALPTSVLHPHLHAANLSHYSFHQGRVKDELLRLASASAADAVVVVGVSYGEEVMRFARAGRRIFAFEPMPLAVESLRRSLHRARPPLDVQLFEMAASDAADPAPSFNVTYKGRTVAVRSDRVDNHVPPSVPVAAMSVDIQGEELHAVQGASRLLPRVRTLWVEIKACGQHNVQLLRLLDPHYALFDFVPWGQPAADPAAATAAASVRHRSAFALHPQRPSEIDAYCQWLCHARRHAFDWLQNDVLAVRRDLLLGPSGAELLRALSQVHRRGCAHGGCRLRELLAAAPQPSQ